MMDTSDWFGILILILVGTVFCFMIVSGVIEAMNPIYEPAPYSDAPRANRERVKERLLLCIKCHRGVE